MKSRALAVSLAAATFVLFAPSRIQADKFKPIYPLRTGLLLEDSSCPGATHSLRGGCPEGRTIYLVFPRVKGLKRFTGDVVVVNGPIVTTSCALPVMKVRQIGFAPQAPPPCP